MQKWALSLPEGVALLKLWILPLFLHVAKVVFPSDGVVDSLTSISKQALNLNFWGITLDILAHSPGTGGYSVAPPKRLLVQATFVLVPYPHHGTHLPAPCCQLAVSALPNLAWHACGTFSAPPLLDREQCGFADYAVCGMECTSLFASQTTD